MLLQYHTCIIYLAFIIVAGVVVTDGVVVATGVVVAAGVVVVTGMVVTIGVVKLWSLPAWSSSYSSAVVELVWWSWSSPLLQRWPSPLHSTLDSHDLLTTSSDSCLRSPGKTAMTLSVLLSHFELIPNGESIKR